MMQFSYFANPENFSFLHKADCECDICSNKTRCFDASVYFGGGSLNTVCPDCLSNGSLEKYDVFANDVSSSEGDLREGLDFKAHSKIILFRTPSLPVWQDMVWPIVNGDFCRFIKIASREDFDDSSDLHSSIHPRYQFGHEAGELWEMLEPNPIRNLDEAQNDISFYLFTAGKEKVVTWEAN